MIGRGDKKFGDRCENTTECGFRGSICDPIKHSCQCRSEFPVTNHIDKCGVGKLKSLTYSIEWSFSSSIVNNLWLYIFYFTELLQHSHIWEKIMTSKFYFKIWTLSALRFLSLLNVSYFPPTTKSVFLRKILYFIWTLS